MSWNRAASTRLLGLRVAATRPSAVFTSRISSLFIAPTPTSSSSSSSSSPSSVRRTISSTTTTTTTPTPESIAQHCRKVICIGRNYAEHISELSSARPSQPFWFLKPTSSLVLPPQSSSSSSSTAETALPKIIVPRGVEAAHEIELGLIIGPVPSPSTSSSSSSPRQKYHNLNLPNLDAALPLIGGYVMGIDVTARNVQWEAKRKSMPWSISKGFDTFLPISRFIPKQRIPNPHDATIWLAVNGEVRQRDSTALFLFDIPRMLNDISKVMTLEEGDIVLTGTPKGVGPLLGGDVVQAGVEVAGEEVPEGRIDVIVEDDTAEGGFVYRET